MYPYLDFISLIVCSLCLFLYCFEAAIERSGIQKFEKYKKKKYNAFKIKPFTYFYLLTFPEYIEICLLLLLFISPSFDSLVTHMC